MLSAQLIEWRFEQQTLMTKAKKVADYLLCPNNASMAATQALRISPH